MRTITPFALLFALAVVSDVRGAPAAVADDVFVASVQGRAWSATRSFAAATSIGGKPAINLSGRIDGATPTMIAFNVIVPALDRCGGSYPLGGSPLTATHGNFNANAGADGNPLEDSYRFVDGAVVIATCDAATHAIAGTFSGHAKNSAGTVLTIEGGRFAQVVPAPTP